MFVNFKHLTLKPSSVFNLLAIKQKETNYLLENLSQEEYSHFETLSFITHIRQKKKEEHLYISLRLSKKGLDFLEKLEEVELLEEDSVVGEWLCKYYLDAGKSVGNKKKLFRHIKAFRVQSGIEKNNLIKLCTHFLKHNEERSNKLEFVFFFPRNVFEVKLDLDGSWLYQHYLQFKQELDNIFEEY